MSFQPQMQDEILGEINMTPLVDVMLVLLIIFIVTVPVMQQTIPIDLPKVSQQATSETPPKPVRITLLADGSLFWQEKKMSSEAEFFEELTRLKTNASPSVHIAADKQTPYEKLAKLMVKLQEMAYLKSALLLKTNNPDIHPREFLLWFR